MQLKRTLTVVAIGLALALVQGVWLQQAEAKKSRRQRRQIARDCLSLTADPVLDYAGNCEGYTGGTNSLCGTHSCLGATGVKKGIDACAQCFENRLGWEYWHAYEECEWEAMDWCEVAVPTIFDLDGNPNAPDKFAPLADDASDPPLLGGREVYQDPPRPVHPPTLLLPRPQARPFFLIR